MSCWYTGLISNVWMCTSHMHPLLPAPSTAGLLDDLLALLHITCPLIRVGWHFPTRYAFNGLTPYPRLLGICPPGESTAMNSGAWILLYPWTMQQKRALGRVPRLGSDGITEDYPDFGRI